MITVFVCDFAERIMYAVRLFMTVLREVRCNVKIRTTRSFKMDGSNTYRAELQQLLAIRNNRLRSRVCVTHLRVSKNLQMLAEGEDQ
jgi:hypothetical protein